MSTIPRSFLAFVVIAAIIGGVAGVVVLIGDRGGPAPAPEVPNGEHRDPASADSDPVADPPPADVRSDPGSDVASPPTPDRARRVRQGVRADFVLFTDPSQLSPAVRNLSFWPFIRPGRRPALPRHGVASDRAER